MDEFEEIKAHMRKQLDEETIDAIEVMIDFKMAEMLNELSRRLEKLDGR